MLNNLFIIDSPLQLLNAVEARGHFQTNNNILIIISYKNHTQRHRDQIENILKVFPWDNIIEIDGKSKSKFFPLLKLIKKIKKNQYNYIFSGNISKAQNAIITSLKKKELFLLDDGLSTLRIYKDGSITNYGKKLKDKLKLLKFKLFGITIKPIENISFFTALNLEEKINHKVVKNDYKSIRKNFKKDITNENSIYLIGQNFIKNNVLTDEEYIKYLSSIKSTFKNKKIAFLPHREENINEKYDKLFDENFELIYFKNNIELEFILNHIYPSTVIGFFSTALTNIKIIFPKTNIISFKPQCKSFEEHYTRPYDYLKENNIKIELL